MEIRTPEGMPPPPGVVKALVGGFNVISSHIALIFFPVALDVFLWLGPRLTVTNLLAPFISEIQALQASAPSMVMDANSMSELFSGLNIFATLRTFPVGIFSLMSVNLSDTTPFGLRMEFAIGNVIALFGLSILLSLVGWLFGSVYFYFVAKAAAPADDSAPFGRAMFQVVLLSGFLTLFASLGSIPVFLFLGVLALINQALGAIAYLMLGLLMMWVAFPLFFSAHGIYLSAQNAFVSLRESFRSVRYGLPSLGGFALVAMVISQGLDLVWRIAPADSWMSLVGIFGHAFVSTSLLAASFIFYREMTQWIEAMLQWLKSQKTSSAQA